MSRGNPGLPGARTLPKPPAGPSPFGSRQWIIGINDLSRLRIVNRQAVLSGQPHNQALNVIGFGPNTCHDDMAWRPVQSHAPRAQIVVVNLLFRYIINLRMPGGQFVVECVDNRARNNVLDVAFAKPAIDLARLSAGQALIRKPDCEITAQVI